jgi:TPR repeat protein
MLRDGIGGTKSPANDTAALQYLTDAARQGDFFAQIAVADMYQHGIGVSAPDPREAASWAKAAEKNPVYVQYKDMVEAQRRGGELVFEGLKALFRMAGQK